MHITTLPLYTLQYTHYILYNKNYYLLYISTTIYFTILPLYTLKHYYYILYQYYYFILYNINTICFTIYNLQFKKTGHTLTLTLRQGSSESSLSLGHVIIKATPSTLSETSSSRWITYSEDTKGLHLYFDTTSDSVHSTYISLLNIP